MRKNINLLPVELRKRAAVKRQKNILVILAGLIIGAVLFGFICFFGLIKYLEYQYAHMESKYMELMPKDVLEKRYQEENAKLKEDVANLEKLQQQKINWTMILQDMNSRLPDHMWITGFTYRNNEKIVISGLTADVAEVGVFIYEMSKSTYIKDLTLVRISEVVTENTVLNKFDLTGTLHKGSE
jgi:Tfp pilus assembly protein PilN